MFPDPTQPYLLPVDQNGYQKEHKKMVKSNLGYHAGESSSLPLTVSNRSASNSSATGGRGGMQQQPLQPRNNKKEPKPQVVEEIEADNGGLLGWDMLSPNDNQRQKKQTSNKKDVSFKGNSSGYKEKEKKAPAVVAEQFQFRSRSQQSPSSPAVSFKREAVQQMEEKYEQEEPTLGRRRSVGKKTIVRRTRGVQRGTEEEEHDD